MANIKHYVSFEQAKKLKELGFSQEMLSVDLFFDDNGRVQAFPPIVKSCAACPTIMDVNDWLYDKFEIFIEVLRIDYLHFGYRIVNVEYDDFDEENFLNREVSEFYKYTDRYEAYNAALDEILNNIDKV